MKRYNASGNNSIVIETMEVPEGSDLVKIKISDVMPTYSDISHFRGNIKTTYPHSLGSVAVGVISDDRLEYGLKRGTKVIINPYETEINDKLNLPNKVKTKGMEMEGLLSDFAYLSVDKITPFPEDVREDEAIFAEKIAIAMATINAFRVEKGDYIVIIGGNALCNIIAQLSMYFQLIPIVVDNNENNLKKMEHNGIYYTIDSTKEVPCEKVMELTGGRMAEHTVLEATSGAPSNFLFNLAREGGDCTIVCENKVSKKMEADLDLISRKQLKVKGVSNGAQEFNSAINILAQKILNFEELIDKKVELENAEVFFKETKEEQSTVIIELL
jgi:threonine dehydrogenase-like Zn-dependent dehydrogenase